jgi:hypothetical protein
MRGEVAVGNMSCGRRAGVASIDATVDVVELKNACRMFRPTMPDAVSKSRIGIFNLPFGLAFVTNRPALSTPGKVDLADIVAAIVCFCSG